MIIRIIFYLDTREVADIVAAADGITAFNENERGVLQGPAEKIIPQALSFLIQAQPILDFIDLHNINIPMATELKQVLRDQSFGLSILQEFLALRKTTETDPDEDLTLMDKHVLGDIRELLYDGSIRSAMIKLQGKPEEIIPSEVKAYFINKMETYLNPNP